MVSGQTLVMTSAFTFSHLLSLPNACEVRTNEVIKKAADTAAPMTTGQEMLEYQGVEEEPEFVLILSRTLLFIIG